MNNTWAHERAQLIRILDESAPEGVLNPEVDAAGFWGKQADAVLAWVHARDKHLDSKRMFPCGMQGSYYEPGGSFECILWQGHLGAHQRSVGIEYGPRPGVIECGARKPRWHKAVKCRLPFGHSGTHYDRDPFGGGRW